MSAAPEEYPQIRGLFKNALRAMAEGETEAEKQIVYVLNEARAALPCPSFVAGRTLYVLRGGEAVGIVSVATASACFEVTSMIGNGWEMADGTLALAHAVARALKSACVVIAQAATEAGPKVMPVEQWPALSDDFMAQADAAQRRILGFADVSPGPSAPENDPKTLRAAMNRAFEEIRGMRKEFGNPDSDYGAGAKEACDRIAAALVITE